MTYNQTKNLFEAMDDLELYAKMYQREMNDEWIGTADECNRYSDLITKARKRIFDALEG